MIENNEMNKLSSQMHQIISKLSPCDNQKVSGGGWWAQWKFPSQGPNGKNTGPPLYIRATSPVEKQRVIVSIIRAPGTRGERTLFSHDVDETGEDVIGIIHKIWDAIYEGAKCPACGAYLTPKWQKRNGNITGAFMGCTRYPLCVGKRKTRRGVETLDELIGNRGKGERGKGE